MSYINSNLCRIQDKIRAAYEKSDRNYFDITLIGVTKTIDAKRISELVSLGIKDLGENRVQELLEKEPVIDSSVNWHLIGHLQTNKVKYIIDKVKLIHSVDSLRLAKEINKQAKANNICANVLIEINIADENSKFGIKPGELGDFLDEMASFSNIMTKGLMCVAPYVENPEENRDYFRIMRRMFVDSGAKSLNNINMQYLSMGMTNDYETAIEEGANMIRVGTGIFGTRDYT